MRDCCITTAVFRRLGLVCQRAGSGRVPPFSRFSRGLQRVRLVKEDGPRRAFVFIVSPRHGLICGIRLARAAAIMLRRLAGSGLKRGLW